MPNEQERLRERVAELERALTRARKEALTDSLTGSLNRRGWDQTLEREDDRCRRHDLDAMVAVIDLDGLKAVNDAKGHAAGDALLRRCAEALGQAIRDHDFLARPGGDEFAVLTVQSSSPSTDALVERLESALADADVRATVAAVGRHEVGGLVEAWHAADRRMLERKRAGR